jgi:hypothetical protein
MPLYVSTFGKGSLIDTEKPNFKNQIRFQNIDFKKNKVGMICNEKNNIICPVCSKIFPGEYKNKQNTNVIILSQPESPIYEYNYLIRQKKCLFFIVFLFVMYTGLEIRYLIKFLFHK